MPKTELPKSDTELRAFAIEQSVKCFDPRNLLNKAEGTNKSILERANKIYEFITKSEQSSSKESQ